MQKGGKQPKLTDEERRRYASEKQGIKKLAKSPIGKAALLYTGAAGLGALGSNTSFMSNFTSPTSFL